MKTGPMSDIERAEIDRLALGMKRPHPGKIAARLDRKESTVRWYMLTHGLFRSPLRYGASEPYLRAGRLVYPYSRTEDARLSELRSAHTSTPKIAAIMTAEFGKPRTAHGVHVRLVQIASSQEASQ